MLDIGQVRTPPPFETIIEELTQTIDYTTQISVFTTVEVIVSTLFYQFLDTTITTIFTSTASANSTSTIIGDQATRPIPNSFNDSPGPSVTATELTGTETTLFGEIVYVEVNRRWSPEYADEEISTSPTAFYVYPTAKIIVVPPVADSNGQLVCATTSSYFTTCGCSTNTQDPLLFPGINSYAEAYFDNSISVTEISLSIPLIYFPLMGANPYANQNKHRRALAPATTYPDPSDGVDVDFGYFPQILIDLMALNPDYVAQYPQLASCLPGGPSIDLSELECPSGNDEFLESPPIPTISSQSTIILNGCFNPGTCPTQAAAPGAIPNAAVPMATAAPDNAPTSGLSPPLGPRKYKVALILLIMI